MSPAAFGFLVLMSVAAQTPAQRPEAHVLVPSPRAGKTDLFLADPSTGTTKNLTASDDRMELWPAWSADGKQIAMASWIDNGTKHTEITVMAADGTARKRLAAPEDGGTCVSPTWAPDGKRLAYSRVFGTPSRSEVRVINADGTDDKVLVENGSFPAWSPDGESIAFCHSDLEKKTSRLAVMKSDGTGIVDLTDSFADVAMLTPAWSPDGRWLAYPAPVNGSIEIHRISPDGKLRNQLTHLGAGTIHPVWLNEDTLLVTHLQPQAGTAYLTIRADGTRLQIHPLSKMEGANALIRPAVQPPRSYAMLKERSSIRQVAHMEAAAQIGPNLIPVVMFRAGNRVLVDTPWSPDGQSFAGVGPDGHVSIAEVAPTSIRTRFEAQGHAEGASAVAWAHDGKRLYTTGMDKKVRLWAPPAIEAAASEEMKDVGGVIAVHPEGKSLAVGHPNGTIVLHDPETLKVRKTITFDEKKSITVLGLAWSKDGSTLYAAGGSGTIPVLGGAVAAFDPETGEAAWRTKSMFGSVAMLALSPDGSRLLGACGDTFVRVWDSSTGKEVHSLKGHGDRVSGITWTPDGRSFASCGLDHTIRVWDSTTGSLHATLAGHLGPVIRVHFRPDGKSLLSTGLDRVLLWKVE